MNLFKKITLGLAFVVGFQATAGMQQLETLLGETTDKAMAFKVLEEIVKKYPKLVLYFGKDSCSYCRNTKVAITQLLSLYPDVMFVMVDLAKYPYFKNGTMPKLRFHKNSLCLHTSDSLTFKKLKELLDQYYR